ncbi:similar to Saccharomyces cerevisiae YIL134W FLX1 Protein required for transport of flavin adenine dinucleotide (FAD), a synthesis product of riboflavin, across the mitochondrial membrane [Maudiozyma barnettii]|uniref:Similar to Saccharomyces cerevisiae YIL134W FLX1 Protein required for transport of flavin adenine dinucleotide (FAD), a synthesis product of riboflavin, across the mitochondrial membrane n=1 Tax=Maudiozyma barnettii TaxID=61262 RepID=A0A8H2VDD7_9SACH|nr:flavin adenine dinucleotide transporter FLX1 [Kazachstania barnettii]CAB4253252.1 similar to Saccharomyces cerevisiae YIL134W FLX1 Protein required for transport of flavin adenine dinucleotide (FAD), a synthesis product of riboflavin, across the mitochondrial membrane [Kazachstania barnettii]CAD1780212.1 similar to Saccharomyces cerevisiae YIL134W FLX1 Protein required for transport of flavin adenine dinucleotide (FAD), a synthesis product of riboflavin, across the mitochondrial membrane [Kaza
MSDTSKQNDNNIKYSYSILQKEIISGLVAGCLTSTIVHPLDLIKLRLQLLSTDSSNAVSKLNKYKHVLQSIKANGHWTTAGLYRGLTINVLGNSIAWSLYFGSYRAFKTLLSTSNQDTLKLSGSDESKLINLDSSMMYLVSGGLAGVFTSVVTNPIWVLKTRIMSTNQNTFNKSYDSIQGTFRSLVSKEGYRSLLKGLTPSILGVSQGALYFMIYDTLKQNRLKIYDPIQRSKEHLNTGDTILITSISKMVSTTTVYPLQLLKSNLQSVNMIHGNSSTWKLTQLILKREGIRGLYNGLATNLFKAVPTTCITFCIYEAMKGYI